MARGDVNIDHQDLLMAMGVFDTPEDERDYRDWLDLLYTQTQQADERFEAMKFAASSERFEFDEEKEKVA